VLREDAGDSQLRHCHTHELSSGDIDACHACIRAAAAISREMTEPAMPQQRVLHCGWRGGRCRRGTSRKDGIRLLACNVVVRYADRCRLQV
jgi:hypothetical protein